MLKVHHVVMSIQLLLFFCAGGTMRADAQEVAWRWHSPQDSAIDASCS